MLSCEEEVSQLSGVVLQNEVVQLSRLDRGEMEPSALLLAILAPGRLWRRVGEQQSA